MALRGLRAKGLNVWLDELVIGAKVGLTVPVSTVGSAKEEILENHYHPVPEDDLASED